MWPFSKPGAETHRNPPPSSSNTPPSSLAPGPSAPKSSSQTGSQASSPQQTNSTGRLSSTGLTTASGMYPNSTIEVGDSGVTVEYVDSESGLPLGSRQLSQTEAAVANKLHNVREAIGNNRMLEAFQHLIVRIIIHHNITMILDLIGTILKFIYLFYYTLHANHPLFIMHGFVFIT